MDQNLHFALIQIAPYIPIVPHVILLPKAFQRLSVELVSE